jgi:hypothetical protein
MEVMVEVQSGTLLRALRVQLKRRVSARRGGDNNEVPLAIQKKSRPSPSNCVTPFACELLFLFVYLFYGGPRTTCRECSASKQIQGSGVVVRVKRPLI